METLPLTLAFIGIGLLVGLSGCGSAMGTAIGAQATVGALKSARNPLVRLLYLVHFLVPRDSMALPDSLFYKI